MKAAPFLIRQRLPPEETLVFAVTAATTNNEIAWSFKDLFQRGGVTPLSSRMDRGIQGSITLILARKRKGPGSAPCRDRRSRQCRCPNRKSARRRGATSAARGTPSIPQLRCDESERHPASTMPYDGRSAWYPMSSRPARCLPSRWRDRLGFALAISARACRCGCGFSRGAGNSGPATAMSAPRQISGSDIGIVGFGDLRQGAETGSFPAFEPRSRYSIPGCRGPFSKTTA